MRAVAALLVVLLAAASVPAEEAEDLIPFEKLDVDLRNELWRVTQRYTVRRKVEEQTVQCPREGYEWLLARLPLASIAARELELGKYVIEAKEADKDGHARFSIDDTEGAFASCERVYEDSGRLVIVARGEVEPKPLPKIKGTGVIVVRWKKDPKDATRTLTDCHVYFRVASDSLHRASQPFRDPLGKALGTKIEGFIACATKVSELAEKDPDKVLKALERSKKVPEADLEAFKKKFMLH